jgi:hypothetical protein
MRPFPPQRAAAHTMIGWHWVARRGISASRESCAACCSSAVTLL